MLEVVADDLALFAAGDDQEVAVTGDAVKRRVAARRECLWKTAAGNPHQRTASAEAIRRRRQERDRLRSILVATTARRDARFAGTAGKGERREQAAVLRRQKIRDLGVAVLLKHDRTMRGGIRLRAGGFKGVDVALRRGAGGDATVAQTRQPADIAIPDLRKECDAAVGELFLIREFLRGDARFCELGQIDLVDPTWIAGCGESGFAVQHQQIENRIHRQADAGHLLTVAHETECAFRRSAGEQRSIRKRCEREDMRFVQLHEFAGRERARLCIERDFENLSVGTGAQQPFRGIFRRREAPEKIGGRVARELRERGPRDEAAVRAGGESFQTAAGGVAEKIDLGGPRERFGVSDDAGQREAGQEQGKTADHGRKTESIEGKGKRASASRQPGKTKRPVQDRP